MPAKIISDEQLAAIPAVVSALRTMLDQATRESKAGYYMQSVSVSAIEDAKKALASLDAEAPNEDQS